MMYFISKMWRDFIAISYDWGNKVKHIPHGPDHLEVDVHDSEWRYEVGDIFPIRYRDRGGHFKQVECQVVSVARHETPYTRSCDWTLDLIPTRWEFR